MNLLAWLGLVARPDSVTADTRAWLDHETRGEQEARAELLAEHVRHGATKAELRTFHRKYGAASAVIGQLRAELAREREARRLDGGDILASATAAARGLRFGGLTRPAEPVLTADQHDRLMKVAVALAKKPYPAPAPGDADATVVDTAERLGNEIQPDRTAAIESAAITLRAHDYSRAEVDTACSCGWDFEWPHAGRRAAHARHVAEQLAAVGALGNLQLSVESSVASSPVLVDRDGDEWLPRPGGSYYCPAEDISRTSRDELDASYGPLSEKAATS